MLITGFPVPGPPGMAPPGMAPPGLAPAGLPMPPATFMAPPGTVPEPPGAGLKHPAGTGLEDDDHTPMKKMRTEETLIPESEFLARHKVDIFIIFCYIPIFFCTLFSAKIAWSGGNLRLPTEAAFSRSIACST